MFEIRLGIAGTAKNTGKTTTTAAVITELRRQAIPLYLTSIGFDGEDLDNVTGLPKPKLRVEPGDVVVTAAKCLAASTAIFSILEETDIRTPLGRILVTRVKKAGLAVTAGPNRSTEVEKIIRILNRFKPGITLFDGALNRIAPLVATDGFILATGAARTNDIPRLSQETACIWRLANLPTVPNAAALTERRPATVTLFDDNLCELAVLPAASILSEHDAAAIAAVAAKGGACLYVPGIIGERAFAYLAEKAGSLPRQLFLVLADPIKLLAFANPVAHYQWIEQLEQHGVFTFVLKRVPLLAITLNPFFPEFRYETATYRPAYIDPLRLQTAVSKQVNIPVYNIMKQGGRGLTDVIMANARKREHPLTTKF